MNVNAKYEGIPVHKWVAAPINKPWRHALEYQKKKLGELFDKLAPLVEQGASITVEHRIVNELPVLGKAYDVLDITVSK